MRTAVVVFVALLVAVFLSQTLVNLQLKPARLLAFTAIAAVSIVLIVQPTSSLYLIIGSVPFHDPRYWFPFLRLWLHQWVILVALLLLAGRWIARRKTFRIHPLDKALAVFLLSFLVSTFNSPNAALSVKWTLYTTMLIGAYLLGRLAIENERDLRSTVLFLIVCGAANSVVSFFTPTVGSRVGALVLDNPNALGNFLSLILPLAVAVAFYSPFSSRVRFFLGGASLAIAFSIILTLSRSSWLGSVVGLTGIGVIKRRFRYLVLLVPVLALSLLMPTVKKRIFEDRTDPGVVYRQVKIRMAWEMFRHHPVLGNGPGAFQALAPEAEEWAVSAHSALENLYLQILAEGGLVQAAIFVALIAIVTGTAISSFRGAGPGLLQTVTLGSLSAVWAALGIGVGENPFYFPMINWLLGLHLGIIVKASELSAAPAKGKEGSRIADGGPAIEDRAAAIPAPGYRPRIFGSQNEPERRPSQI